MFKFIRLVAEDICYFAKFLPGKIFAGLWKKILIIFCR